MKYALLIYSPTTADEYGANLDRQRRAADGERGPWVDYTRAAREAGALTAVAIGAPPDRRVGLADVGSKAGVGDQAGVGGQADGGAVAGASP